MQEWNEQEKSDVSTAKLYFQNLKYYFEDPGEGSESADPRQIWAQLQGVAYDAYEMQRCVSDVQEDPGALWEACHRSLSCTRMEADAAGEKGEVCARAMLLHLQPLHSDEVRNACETKGGGCVSRGV